MPGLLADCTTYISVWISGTAASAAQRSSDIGKVRMLVDDLGGAITVVPL